MFVTTNFVHFFDIMKLVLEQRLFQTLFPLVLEQRLFQILFTLVLEQILFQILFTLALEQRLFQRLFILDEFTDVVNFNHFVHFLAVMG